MAPERAAAQSSGWRNWLHRAGKRALRSLPELAAARLESEARKLGPATIPRIFSRDLRPLDSTFNEELLEFAGRAELTLRNRFRFLNQAQAYGREIGWETPPGRAWRAELHSFDFALDLAVMFRVSGEERYSRHLRYLIADWTASNPPLETTGWEIGPLARRIRNWALAYDLARAVWQSDAEFARVASRSLAIQCLRLEQQWRAQAPDARAPEAAVALLLSSRIFMSPAGDAHRELALRALHDMIERDLPASGSRQPNPAARVRLARAILEFILFEPQFGAETVAWLKKSLERALHSVEEILLADASLPLFGPAPPPHSEALDDLFAASAVVLDSGWAKGIGQNFGILPLLFLGHSARERFVQLAAADWSPAHVASSLPGLYRLAGPAHSSLVVTATLPAQSSHQDLLSFELMLRGMRVVVDSGSIAPEGESEEGYFPSAKAHNILLMDGALAGLPRAGETCPCQADLAVTGDFARLRVAVPAGPDGFPRQRIFFSLADGAWIVLDRISDARPHRFESLLHFFPTFEATLCGDFATVNSRSLSFAVVPFGTSSPRLFTGRAADAKCPGWYSPDYGIRYEASVLACEWNPPASAWTGGYLVLPIASAETAPPRIIMEGTELSLESGGHAQRLPLGPI